MLEKISKKRIYNISNYESIVKNNLCFQIKYFENHFKYADILHHSEISTNEDFLSRIIEIVVIDRYDRPTQTLNKISAIRLINLLTYQNSKNEKTKSN